MYSQPVFGTEQLFDSPSSTVTSHCILNNTMFKHEKGEPIGRSHIIRVELLYSLGASLLKLSIDQKRTVQKSYLHKYLIIKPTRCTNFSNLFLE